MGGALVGCLSLLVVANTGFIGRLPESLQPLANHKLMTDESKCSERVSIPSLGKQGRHVCVFGAPFTESNILAVLWGDSHAGHLAPLLDLAAKKQGITIVRWKGCAPFVDDQSLRRKKQDAEYTSKCGNNRKAVLNFINTEPRVKLVIIANAWPSFGSRRSRADLRFRDHRQVDGADTLYVDASSESLQRSKALPLMEKGLTSTLAEIAPQRSVLLIGDVPRPDFLVPDCVMQKALNLWRKLCAHNTQYADRSAVVAYHRPTESILDRLGSASASDGVFYWDLINAICGPEGCPLRINGEVIYADGSHLRLDLSLDTKKKLVTLVSFRRRSTPRHGTSNGIFGGEE